MLAIFLKGRDFEKINISSRYTKTNLLKEVPGALVRPKGMTWYSKCPKGVLNAIFVISFPNSDQVVDFMGIQFREKSCALKWGECRINKWQRVLVFDSNVVKPLKSIQGQRKETFFSTKNKNQHPEVRRMV